MIEFSRRTHAAGSRFSPRAARQHLPPAPKALVFLLTRTALTLSLLRYAQPGQSLRGARCPYVRLSSFSPLPSPARRRYKVRRDEECPEALAAPESDRQRAPGPIQSSGDSLAFGPDAMPQSAAELHERLTRALLLRGWPSWRAPVLNIALKVIKQLIHGHEDVGQLFPGDVAMIAFAALVVVAHPLLQGRPAPGKVPREPLGSPIPRLLIGGTEITSRNPPSHGDGDRSATRSWRPAARSSSSACWPPHTL